MPRASMPMPPSARLSGERAAFFMRKTPVSSSQFMIRKYDSSRHEP